MKDVALYSLSLKEKWAEWVWVELLVFISAVRLWILEFADWFLALLTSQQYFHPCQQIPHTYQAVWNSGVTFCAFQIRFVLSRPVSFFLHSSLTTKFCMDLEVAQFMFLITKIWYYLSAFVPRSMYFHMHIVSILVLLVLPIRPQAHSIGKPQNQAMQNSVKSKDKWCLQRKLPASGNWTITLEIKKEEKRAGWGLKYKTSGFSIGYLKILLDRAETSLNDCLSNYSGQRFYRQRLQAHGAFWFFLK